MLCPISDPALVVMLGIPCGGRNTGKGLGPAMGFTQAAALGAWSGLGQSGDPSRHSTVSKRFKVKSHFLLLPASKHPGVSSQVGRV